MVVGGTPPTKAKFTKEFSVISTSTAKDLDNLGIVYMHESAHGISDFQVLALTGHIGNFKSIVLHHFLQGEQKENERELKTTFTLRAPQTGSAPTFDLNFMILNFSESALNSW